MSLRDRPRKKRPQPQSFGNRVHLLTGLSSFRCMRSAPSPARGYLENGRSASSRIRTGAVSRNEVAVLSISLRGTAAPRRSCRSDPRAHRLLRRPAAKRAAAPHEAPVRGGSSPPPAPVPRDVGATVPGSALAPCPPSGSSIVGLVALVSSPSLPPPTLGRDHIPSSGNPLTPPIQLHTSRRDATP